jgi:hypothetical protein
MPSTAFTQHLLVLLEDADELNDAHVQQRTGRPGRQWGLGAINRAVVVLCVQQTGILLDGWNISRSPL